MGQPLRLLIIEDSEEDALLLARELKRGGYDLTWEREDTPEGVRHALISGEWDVVTSDYNMPQFNALIALSILKESGLDLPFIVVSGKIGEETAVEAMKAGAHDYVMKNNLPRLVPAIDREIREAEERRKRREAEVALQTQFNQFSTIFDSMNAVIYVADLESYELLYMNKYGESLFGNWLGKPCYMVMQAGTNGPCAICSNERLVKDGVPLPPVIYEFQNTATGAWYQGIDRAIRWTDGRLVRMQIAVDITERKEGERLKDEMISAVSHEMRTPLTAMLGFLEYLMDNPVEHDQLISSLETVHKETVRLGVLIDNFLDLQTMKERVSLRDVGPVSIQPLLTEVAKLFAGDQQRHRITVTCPPDLPTVSGDENRLHQVLTNLLSNACKYSPHGSRIELGARALTDELLIWVKDEGMGVPEEARDKVFDKFYRVDNSDSRKIGGTGLGLALVKEIIEAHGGRVWVESATGSGSTFWVSLPLIIAG